jgi:uncharacterized protein YbjT (DUF2867 family)
MIKPTVLVTGATGKTGSAVVAKLRGLDFPVRALVHRLDHRSQRLGALGAEIVVGDFLEPQSIRSAMAGARRVYFCYPPQGDRLLEAASNIAVAARDEGIEALVNMSQLPARENASSPLTRQHWLSEQVFDWAGIGAAHVRPTFFAEMLYLLNGTTIAEEGKIYLPFGEVGHAPVTVEDVAEVVADMLAEPEQHVGHRHVLTGPETMTIDQMAEVLTQELGAPVTYVDLPIDRWRQALTEEAKLPPFLVNHLTSVAKEHQQGVFNVQTETVERLSGQPPQSLRAFVRAHRAAFGSRPRVQTHG